MKKSILLGIMIFLWVGSVCAMKVEMPPLVQYLFGDGEDNDKNALLNISEEQLKDLLVGGGKLAVELGNAAEEFFKNDKDEFERNIVQSEGNIATLEKAIQEKRGSVQIKRGKKKRRSRFAEYEQVLGEEKARLKLLKSNLKKLEKDKKYWDGFGRNLVDQGTGLLFGKLKSKLEQRAILEQLAVKIGIEGDKRNEGIKQSISQLTEAKTLVKTSGMILATMLGVTGGYYGFKLGYNWLNAKIGKPTLVRESTRHGWRHSVTNFWYYGILGYEEDEMKLEDVVLAEEMEKKLLSLAQETRNTMANGLPFRHVLFYGPPGTGKTMFAKRLAIYSEMDYAIMSGADFAQFKDGEGIVELHKLFDWAEQSAKGLVIFVDEADAFLRDRRVLDNQGKNLVNAFLSRTGTSAKKYMLVFATNYKDELDPAALSRIHKKVPFDLPAFDERTKIFNLYFDKYVTNDVRVIIKDGNEYHVSINVDPAIEQSFIQSIAQKIDGFSGRQIEQLVSELRISAYNLGNGKLTKEIVMGAVDEKLQEHKHDMQCSKFQRKRYEVTLGQSQLSMGYESA